MKLNANIRNILQMVYIVLSFIFVDFWLRFLTKELGLYSIYEIPPNLFTFFWSLIISCFLFLVSNKKLGRVFYGIIYFVCSIYAIVQYGYYLIFGKFLFLSDFMFAGEGSDYFSYILDILNLKVILQVVLLVIIGVVGIFFYPDMKRTSWKKCLVTIGIIALSFAGILYTPNLYRSVENSDKNSYRYPAFEYERFVNSAYDVELTGIYQYVVKDAYHNFKKNLGSETAKTEVVNQIETYFSEKSTLDNNDMTGIFAGKNVIVVMMESIDDWLVTEQDMPTLYYMMQNGINFENMYTPSYSSGYTINTEFAFNTSIYPLSTENYVNTLAGNNFNQSIANVFKNNGYVVNSYHYNDAEYYNRGELHQAFGYESYNSFFEYEPEYELVRDDRFIYECDELYEKITDRPQDKPFMSFIITVSAHLVYDPRDPLYTTATDAFPQYYKENATEEDVIRAKARLTDEMFKGLLKRLEDDGILNDTVIVGFADHYAYGIVDDELLEQRSKEAGNSVLENTPAFIYCASLDEPIVVDKVTQIVDLAPTVENLFGLEHMIESMGNDAFDESYDGYAIFPNNTWITNDAYMKDGVLEYNYGMSDVEIIRMNDFVQQTYLVNDYLLEYDYYDYED